MNFIFTFKFQGEAIDELHLRNVSIIDLLIDRDRDKKLHRLINNYRIQHHEELDLHSFDSTNAVDLFFRIKRNELQDFFDDNIMINSFSIEKGISLGLDGANNYYLRSLKTKEDRDNCSIFLEYLREARSEYPSQILAATRKASLEACELYLTPRPGHRP